MFGIIDVNVDSSKINAYLHTLQSARDDMRNEIEELKRKYNQAQWNDMVSEKARVRLNAYIDALNSAIGDLDSIIIGVEEMYEELENYARVADSTHFIS